MKNKLTELEVGQVIDIVDKLRTSPSYLRWSYERIAQKYGCSLTTAQTLKNRLNGVKSEYNRNLRVKSRNQNQTV
jgi:hypothetical protein